MRAHAGTALLGLVVCLVGALGFAALMTGLREPRSARGVTLMVLGAAALVLSCRAADRGLPVRRR